jgi:hypothetical protein
VAAGGCARRRTPGLKILEGALKRATGDEPEFPAVREYRDELVERIKGSEPRPGA